MGAAHASQKVLQQCTQPCLKHCTTSKRAKTETAECSGPCAQHCYLPSSGRSTRSNRRSVGSVRTNSRKVKK